MDERETEAKILSHGHPRSSICVSTEGGEVRSRCVGQEAVVVETTMEGFLVLPRLGCRERAKHNNNRGVRMRMKPETVEKIRGIVNLLSLLLGIGVILSLILTPVEAILPTLSIRVGGLWFVLETPIETGITETVDWLKQNQ